MNFRNAQYNAFGTIDCEIEHPVYGWIPFTAAPDDPEKHGRDIYAEVLKAGPSEYVAPVIDPAEALAQERQEALAYLASTDWMVVRMAETGKPIPNDVIAAREKARTKAGSV